MIPSSTPKLFVLYTLPQSKLIENHTLHSSTNLYSPYMAVPPPPRGFHIPKSLLRYPFRADPEKAEKAIKGCNLREKKRHSIGMIRIWISDPRSLGWCSLRAGSRVWVRGKIAQEKWSEVMCRGTWRWPKGPQLWEFVNIYPPIQMSWGFI